jgi:hypothetical protein
MASTIGRLTSWRITSHHMESDQWMPGTCNHCAVCSNPEGARKDKLEEARLTCAQITEQCAAFRELTVELVE